MKRKKIAETMRFVMAHTHSQQERDHVRRVLAYTRILANKKKKINKNTLYMAAILHDIGRTHLAEAYGTAGEKGHAAISAAAAYEYLVKEGWSLKKTEKICACIRAHSRNSGPKPTTREAKILFDADKLDMLGAIGIARKIGYAYDEDRPLYTKDRADRFHTDNKTQMTIEEHLFTKKARKIARRRKGIMTAYYRALIDEASFVDK